MVSSNLVPQLTLSPEALLVVGIILLFTGVVVAFFGRAVVRSLMALLGGLIGGSLGFLAGALLGFMAGPIGSFLLALILSLVGAAIGALLFRFLLKAGLAALMGLLAGGLLYSQLSNFVLAIFGFVVVFALAFYFIDELMGVITALVGGILAGLGIFLLTNLSTTAFVVGALLALAGAVVQTIALPRYHRPSLAPRPR